MIFFKEIDGSKVMIAHHSPMLKLDRASLRAEFSGAPQPMALLTKNLDD